MKLLLVEDDPSLGATLQERLLKESYQVDWAQSFAQAKKSLLEERYDLVLLDVTLPDGDGFALAKVVQEKTPFLFMTAMSSAENRLAAYEMGAQEFIPKPFHLKELLLRVQHVLEAHQLPHEIIYSEGKLDLLRMTIVRKDGYTELLQPRDFQLLKLLIQVAPRVLSRDEILNKVWGEDKFPSNRTVDNAIVRLRQGLGSAELIRSVRGLGYQWVNDSQ